MTPEEIQEQLNERNPDAIVMHEFTYALQGIAIRCSQPDLPVYSFDKMVEVMMKAGSSYEEAVDHIGINIAGGWVGVQTPLVLVCEQTVAPIYDVPDEDLVQLEDGYFYWFPKRGAVNSPYLRFIADVLDAKNMAHDIQVHRDLSDANS
jgi:hypothetical protein